MSYVLDYTNEFKKYFINDIIVMATDEFWKYYSSSSVAFTPAQFSHAGWKCCWCFWLCVLGWEVVSSLVILLKGHFGSLCMSPPRTRVHRWQCTLVG